LEEEEKKRMMEGMDLGRNGEEEDVYEGKKE
jgi:hypothetical protein